MFPHTLARIATDSPTANRANVIVYAGTDDLCRFWSGLVPVCWPKPWMIANWDMIITQAPMLATMFAKNAPAALAGILAVSRCT